MLPQSEIDVVRSALCCLCYVEADAAKPIHTNHINKYLHQFLNPEAVKKKLDLLETLQEFVKLPNGYWYPAPMRQVPWIESSIVIAPHSTQELQRTLHLPISTTSNGRFIVGCSSSQLPVQSIDAWMGRPPDLVEWGAKIFSESKSRLASTMHSGELIDVYTPLELSRWTKLSRGAAIADGMYLCRRPQLPIPSKYFIGQIFASALRAEASLDVDHVQLRYAIDLRLGVANKFTCRYQAEKVFIEFGNRMPEAEHRLLCAIGSPLAVEEYRPVYEIQSKYLQPVILELKRLGLIRGT